MSEHDSEFFKTIMSEPLDYRLTYEPACTFIEGNTAPIFVLELMAKGEPTDIKWYAWIADGGWRTPWAQNTKFHSTLESALQECLLRLLQYSGLCEDAAGPPINVVHPTVQ